MAYTLNNISTADNTAWSDDCPIIIPYNYLNDEAVTMAWVQSGSSYSGVDHVDSSYPTNNARNGYNTEYTTHTANSTNARLNCVLDTVTVDTMFHHQTPPSGSVGNNYMTIADDTEFTTNSDAVVDINYSTVSAYRKRVMRRFLDGSTPVEAESLQYIYWQAVPSAGTKFQVNELWVGKRIQLQHREQYPSDYESLESTWKDNRSFTGMYSRKDYGDQGRRMFTLNFLAGDSTEAEILRSIWEQSNHGANPIVYCHRPTTAPDDAGIFYIANKEIRVPETGANQYIMQLQLIEQGGSPLEAE